MLRTLIRRLGIAAKKIAPPGTLRYRLIQRLSWLLPGSLRANYEGDPIAEQLHRLAEAHTDLFFLQVGSHEGQAGDPLSLYIKRDGWRGILVEPVPELFERLQVHYAGCAGLIFENVAVAEHNERRRFFKLRESAGEVYDQADSLGSLDRPVILSHGEQVPGIERYLEEIEVRCVSFSSLLDRHAVDHIDLLHIDAEGYDAKLLDCFPWQRLEPHYVLYEHDHLSTEERAAAESMLQGRGYQLRLSRTNTLAVKT